MLLGLEIDSAYRSRFKSPSEGIKLYHKLARTAAPANLPVPPTNWMIPISAPAAGSKFPLSTT